MRRNTAPATECGRSEPNATPWMVLWPGQIYAEGPYWLNTRNKRRVRAYLKARYGYGLTKLPHGVHVWITDMWWEKEKST